MVLEPDYRNQRPDSQNLNCGTTNQEIPEPDRAQATTNQLSGSPNSPVDLLHMPADRACALYSRMSHLSLPLLRYSKLD